MASSDFDDDMLLEYAVSLLYHTLTQLSDSLTQLPEAAQPLCIDST